MTDAVETMAYAGEVPWHRQGIKVDPTLSAEEMMIAAGLDWEVHKKEAIIEVDKKRYKTGKQALYRVKKTGEVDVLSVVGKGWNPVQNSEAFGLFDEFIRSGDMEMHTAGSLMNGQIVWVLAKMKGGFQTVKGDETLPFLLFTNPHQYGRPVDVRFTPTRVVCWNTLSMALSGMKSQNVVKLNHRLVFDAERVKEMVGLAKSRFDEYAEMTKFLASKKADMDLVGRYFDEIFPRTSDAKKTNLPSKQYGEALKLLESQPGHEFAAGSWWQPFNAVTYITNHTIGKDATRLSSAWYGSNKGRNMKALNLAVEYAKAA